jgi:hypothetical protein
MQLLKFLVVNTFLLNFVFSSEAYKSPDAIKRDLNNQSKQQSNQILKILKNPRVRKYLAPSVFGGCLGSIISFVRQSQQATHEKNKHINDLNEEAQITTKKLQDNIITLNQRKMAAEKSVMEEEQRLKKQDSSRMAQEQIKKQNILRVQEIQRKLEFDQKNLALIKEQKAILESAKVDGQSMAMEKNKKTQEQLEKKFSLEDQLQKKQQEKEKLDEILKQKKRKVHEIQIQIKEKEPSDQNENQDLNNELIRLQDLEKQIEAQKNSMNQTNEEKERLEKEISILSENLAILERNSKETIEYEGNFQGTQETKEGYETCCQSYPSQDNNDGDFVNSENQKTLVSEQNTLFDLAARKKQAFLNRNNIRKGLLQNFEEQDAQKKYMSEFLRQYLDEKQQELKKHQEEINGLQEAIEYLRKFRCAENEKLGKHRNSYLDILDILKIIRPMVDEIIGAINSSLILHENWMPLYEIRNKYSTLIDEYLIGFEREITNRFKETEYVQTGTDIINNSNRFIRSFVGDDFIQVPDHKKFEAIDSYLRNLVFQSSKIPLHIENLEKLAKAKESMETNLEKLGLTQIYKVYYGFTTIIDKMKHVIEETDISHLNKDCSSLIIGIINNNKIKKLGEGKKEFDYFWNLFIGKINGYIEQISKNKENLKKKEILKKESILNNWRFVKEELEPYKKMVQSFFDTTQQYQINHCSVLVESDKLITGAERLNFASDEKYMVAIMDVNEPNNDNFKDTRYLEIVFSLNPYISHNHRPEFYVSLNNKTEASYFFDGNNVQYSYSVGKPFQKIICGQLSTESKELTPDASYEDENIKNFIKIFEACTQITQIIIENKENKK